MSRQNSRGWTSTLDPVELGQHRRCFQTWQFFASAVQQYLLRLSSKFLPKPARPFPAISGWALFSLDTFSLHPLMKFWFSSITIICYFPHPLKSSGKKASELCQTGWLWSAISAWHTWWVALILFFQVLMRRWLAENTSLSGAVRRNGFEAPDCL